MSKIYRGLLNNKNMTTNETGGPSAKEMGLTKEDISADKAHKTPDRTTGKPEHANPVFNEGGQTREDKASKTPDRTTGKAEHANTAFSEEEAIAKSEERLKGLFESNNTNDLMKEKGPKKEG